MYSIYKKIAKNYRRLSESDGKRYEYALARLP